MELVIKLFLIDKIFGEYSMIVGVINFYWCIFLMLFWLGVMKYICGKGGELDV